MAAKKKSKKKNQTVQELEKLANNVGLKVSYGDMKFAGLKLKSGHCVFKDEHWLILSRKDSSEDKIELFAEALKNFDLDEVELSQELQKILTPNLLEKEIPA